MIIRKYQNAWRLNNTCLNNTRVIDKISKTNFKYFELNKNERTAYPNLWNAAKLVF